MQPLPAESMSLIVAFAPLFSKPDFEFVKVLLDGDIFATGKRPIMACRGKSQLAGNLRDGGGRAVRSGRSDCKRGQPQ